MNDDPYRAPEDQRFSAYEAIVRRQSFGLDPEKPMLLVAGGALVHDGVLILPYAVSDTATRFASVRLGELLDALRAN